MIISNGVKNVNGGVAFSGIPIGKGLNEGVKLANRVAKGLSKEADSFTKSKIPNEVVTHVLGGPKEVKAARKVVAAYSALNAGTAATLAQTPLGDKAALTANEFTMAMIICKKIYGFKLSSSAGHAFATGLGGMAAGMKAFEWASSSLTWIPGLGNVLNSAVATSTTAIIGEALIRRCEHVQKEMKRGKALDEIIKEFSKKRR